MGEAPNPFEVRLIEQENSGIGATRNRGYREAKCDLILFLDDDILVKADTVKLMLSGLRECGSPVMFGGYPFKTHNSETLRKFAVVLYGYDRAVEVPKYEKVDAITSGLLIVDRSKLPDSENFYRDDLSIPAAEEHDVIARFFKDGLPIHNALHISAVHNHHLELNWLAQQQYKYGLATAEAYEKVSELVEMPRYAELREQLSFSGPKGLAKRVLASKAGRSLMLRLARFAETLAPNSDNNRLFGLTASAWFWGGVADGRKRFANN
jgi:glycosyltransferase involved in cell wall biosynthesis